MATLEVKLMGHNRDRVNREGADDYYEVEINMSESELGHDNWGRRIVDVINRQRQKSGRQLLSDRVADKLNDLKVGSSIKIGF